MLETLDLSLTLDKKGYQEALSRLDEQLPALQRVVHEHRIPVVLVFDGWYASGRGDSIAQLVQPGTPLLFGGSPAIFDIRYETTPMGAIETTMLTCAAAEIGRRLGLPTQGYISLSDSKALDAPAGLETGIGATLAALAGLDNVSGPGMLDFESCQSLEKLVVDHEICLMTDRLTAGIEPPHLTGGSGSP